MAQSNKTRSVNLALLHPRLFNSLILIDPVMQARPPPGPIPAKFFQKTIETQEATETFETLQMFPLFLSIELFYVSCPTFLSPVFYSLSKNAPFPFKNQTDFYLTRFDSRG